jgi:hypothetical protein
MAVTPTQTFLSLGLGSAALLIVASCENRFGYCTAALSPAVLITPLDSGTRANVAVGARGVAITGTYVDSLRLVDSALWGGMRKGTYQVLVERPGYHQWFRTGIRVTETTDCGMPVSVPVTALLQPAP